MPPFRAPLRLGAAALVAAALATGCGSGPPEQPTVTIEVASPAADTGAGSSTGPAADPAAGSEPDATAQSAQSAGEDVPSDVDPATVQASPTAAPPSAAGRPRLVLRAPRGTHPVIWVRAGKQVVLRSRPGGGRLVDRVGRRTRFGSPSVFGVVRRRGSWVGVTTALLPNNRLAWIRLDPRRIDGGWTRYSIVVDLSERRASLYEGNSARRSFAVTVGAPGSDTPMGRFAVTDTFTGLDSAAYGCCALALSATQPNLPSGWLGGSLIAIHGTAGPLGVAASHGCVRAADPDVAWLVRTVPLGTPVVIRA